MYTVFTAVQKLETLTAVFHSLTKTLQYQYCFKNGHCVKFLIQNKRSIKIAFSLSALAGHRHRIIIFDCNRAYAVYISEILLKDFVNKIIKKIEILRDIKSCGDNITVDLFDHKMTNQGNNSISRSVERVLSSSADTYIAYEEVQEEFSKIPELGTTINSEEGVGAVEVKEITFITPQEVFSNNIAPKLASETANYQAMNEATVSFQNVGEGNCKKSVFYDMRNRSVRWMFDISSWHPSEEEWALALSSVQAEECARICRFAFRRDARASLIGRLLARLFVSQALSLPWCSIHLKRNYRGKPVVQEGLTNAKVNFSISHAGHWCVLAGEAGLGEVVADAIGVDVVEEKHRDAMHLLRIMQRNLSPSEQSIIDNCGRSAPAVFFRLWALKESYLKATGEGIGGGPELCDLSFSLCNIHLPTIPGVVEVGTRLEVKGKPLPCGWHFEESRIDDSHIVAVAVSGSENNSYGKKPDPPAFQKISWAEIQPHLQCLTQQDRPVYLDYFTKPESPSYLQSKNN